MNNLNEDVYLHLNTSEFMVATAPKSFDSTIMNEMWIDECPKYIVESEDKLNKQKRFIVGKEWKTSYTPEEDSLSFKEAKEKFND